MSAPDAAFAADAFCWATEARYAADRAVMAANSANAATWATAAAEAAARAATTDGEKDESFD